MPITYSLTKSPMQRVTFQGCSVYVKRDDLLDAQVDSTLAGSAFSGNKARKLQFYLDHDFPDVNRVISYGSAQSNMLYSLSVLAKLKGWQLEFYVDHIAAHLTLEPRGNYAAAMSNGAKILEVGKQQDESTESYVRNHILPNQSGVLYIPEGGRNNNSEYGIKKLAEEIKEWVNEQQIKNPKVMLPSGTGTTALFLQKHLPFDVLTCACVGSEDYLRAQFLELNANRDQHPTILPILEQENGGVDKESNKESKKYHFGKLYPELFCLWRQLLNETEVEFDLLYDPLGWRSMLQYLSAKAESTEQLIYVHQGGTLGNETMLARYRRMGVDRDPANPACGSGSVDPDP